MRHSFGRKAVVTTWMLLVAGIAAAGELRGRLLLGERPAPGVSVLAVPFEAPLEQARREARRLPAPAPLATVASGADGAFVLTVAPQPAKDAQFTLRTQGGGTVPVVIPGVFDATETDDLGDHVLLPASKLSGKVSDARGKPVADAEVTLVTAPDRLEQADLEGAARATKTAADGSFHFDDAGDTGNTLTVAKAGMAAMQVAGAKGGALAKPLVLGAAAPISGIVRQSDGKSPANGVLVRVDRRAASGWVETGADGSFTVSDAPSGVVTLIADAGELGYVALPEIALPLAAGKTLTLVLRPPATLAGRTLDAKTSRPVPRAKVELRSGALVRTARSGPDGAYSIRAVPPGAWRVAVDEPHYVRWTQASLILRAGESRRLDVPLVLGAMISGRVTDEQGKPVASAAGTLVQPSTPPLARAMRRMRAPEPPTFRTGADGAFRATRLAPGEAQILTVAHTEFEPTTVGGLSLAGGAVKAGVNVILKRGGIVTGVVKDGEGRPIAGAQAELSEAATFRGGRGPGQAFLAVSGAGPQRHKADPTGGDGKFTIRGVAPGEYTLTVARAGYATERVDPVKVPASGSPAPLEVRLVPGAVISGRVITKSGVGVEGYTVVAMAPGVMGPGRRAGGPTAERTGPDGSFAIEGLKPGDAYDLRLLGATGMTEAKHSVTAPATDLQLVVAGNGRITGKVLDAQSGQPVTDFQVSYGADRGAPGGMRVAMWSALSGASGAGQPVGVHSDDGSFTLEDVGAGTWSVLVTADGYQPAHTAGVTVEEGATRDGVEVRLSKGVALKGRVLDATSGAAVANATVSLASTGGRPGPPGPLADATSNDVTTDPAGQFELDGIAAGKQTLHVSHPDYTDATQTVDVKNEGASVEVRMVPGSAIGGVVISDSSQPVASATVTLSQEGGAGFGFLAGGGQASVTDSAGLFRFDHLGSGRYSLSASLGSHTSAPLEVVLQSGQSQPGVTLQLQLGVTIQGTVSGLPEGMVAGTTVGANGANAYSQTTRVAADGRFEFDNVPPGVVNLRATATDPSGSTRSVTKQVEATADQPVLVADLVFDQGYSLSGRVTQSGAPVSGAMVFANLQGGGGRQASASSDDGGAYQLTGLQQGTYTVAAMSPTIGASKRQTIAIASDQTLDIAFPSAKIAGQVVDANGKAPLANATISITAQDPGVTGGFGQRPATTDSNGQFSFSGLDEGSYSLATSKPDYQTDTRTANAGDSGTDALVIELARAAGIAIRVMDGLAGVPLHGVMVRVFDAQGAGVFGPAPITLDGDGQGEIPALPPGAYTVMAAASGYAAVRLDGVNVPSATVMIALVPGGTVLIQAGAKTLAAGTASGTITTVAGQPAMLSLFNLQGTFAISEPTVQLRNVPPGGYLLNIPALGVAQPFTVTTAGTASVQLP